MEMARPSCWWLGRYARRGTGAITDTLRPSPAIGEYINVDPLGHGVSDTPYDADSYEAAGVTADLVAVLDAEGIERATVWGYSRGGWLTCNLASRHADRVDRIVVAAYAMDAHEEEVGRLLQPLAAFLRKGNWSGLWEALGVTDRVFAQMMQDSNDPLAVAAAIDGSLRPTRYIDVSSIRCPATYYVGSEDWILPHVRKDVAALGATLDVIDGQAHIGSFSPQLSRCWPRCAPASAAETLTAGYQVNS